MSEEQKSEVRETVYESGKEFSLGGNVYVVKELTLAQDKLLVPIITKLGLENLVKAVRPVFKAMAAAFSPTTTPTKETGLTEEDVKGDQEAAVQNPGKVIGSIDEATLDGITSSLSGFINGALTEDGLAEFLSIVLVEKSVGKFSPDRTEQIKASVDEMTNSQIVAVLADFFTTNRSSIGAFLQSSVEEKG